MSERKLPPVDWIGVASMVLTIVSAIYLASYIPKQPPLAPAIALMAGSGALLIANVMLLARIRGFAWRTFRTVAKWTLVAYIVIAGMIEYAIVYDHTRGAVLVLMTLSLVSFAANVPVLLGFGVARYAAAD